MRSATVLTLLSASLAAAGPLHQVFHKLHKKAIVTHYETVVDTVTVTAPAIDSQPAPTPAPQVAQVKVPEQKVHTHVEVTTVVVGGGAPAASPAPAAPPVVAAPAPVAASPSPSPVAPAPVVQAPASSVVAAPASSPTDYTSTAVYNHNQHRLNHTADDLAWNQTLADWAGITAAKCVFAHDMSEGTANYGQNIAAYGVSSGVPDTTKAMANAITDMWYYGEVNEFPFGVASPDTSGFDFLHFSQAVWKGSQTVGCATHQCGPNTVLGGANYDSLFTVCNYFPAGNMMGEFNTQVTKSTDKVPTLVANI